MVIDYQRRGDMLRGVEFNVNQMAIIVAHFKGLECEFGRVPTFEEYAHMDEGVYRMEVRTIFRELVQNVLVPEFAKIVHVFSDELTLEKVYDDLLEYARSRARCFRAEDK